MTIEQLGDMDFCYDEDGETELCNGEPVTDFMVLDFRVRCEKELEFCPAKNQTWSAVVAIKGADTMYRDTNSVRRAKRSQAGAVRRFSGWGSCKSTNTRSETL